MASGAQHLSAFSGVSLHSGRSLLSFHSLLFPAFFFCLFSFCLAFSQLFKALLVHHAVRQGPVSPLGAEAKVLGQIHQTVVGQLRHILSGHKKGVYVVIVQTGGRDLLCCPVQKFHVKGMDIVAYQHVSAGKIKEFPNCIPDAGCAGHHGIGDAVYCRSAPGNLFFGIDQGGKSLFHLTGPHPESGDLNDPVRYRA